VTCQSCGHQIADNAIVCYRCGAPTAIPPPARPPEAKSGGRPSRLLVIVVVVLVVVAAAVALKFGWHLL
jgi:hypothetical protein